MASRRFHPGITGAEIYHAAQPQRSVNRKRTRKSSATALHLYLDFDIGREIYLISHRAPDVLPESATFTSISPGKYRTLWRVCSALEQQESALKLLVITFGADPACTDCNRVLRLPGFLNCKYDPAYRITVEYPGDSTWNCEDFRLDILAADATLLSRSVTLRKPPDKHTNSERDWGWVLHELTQGKDAAKLTRKLASRRADKPNPVYYAQRTVDVASARLWLIEGVPTDDVATMLEVRRSFEIPIALCRARAREIVQTAKRMIARERSLSFNADKGAQMPLLEINQIRSISASVRLDETTAEQIDEYAAFVRASADDVVDKALNCVFSKGRDFRDFLKRPQAKQAASTLRIRRGASRDGKEAAEQPAKKLVAGVESTASVRVSKA